VPDARGAMADSSFWRGLAEKFRAVDTHGMLRAEWDYIVGSGGHGEWKLAGAGRSATIQFETLAKRGAAALSDAGTSNLLIVWLEVLRLTSGNFKSDRYGIEQNADGSEGAHHQTGTIWRVCEASADYCNGLESNALEAEALKEIEQPGRAPDEEIPESVGQAIADAEIVLRKKSFATPLGRNLDRLRRESGWSYGDMATAAEIDKKLILGHVNKGKKANPGTLATYARTFTEKLGRPVTVAELEG
jgi:hypothetical protein